jgi:hypothetical protein
MTAVRSAESEMMSGAAAVEDQLERLAARWERQAATLGRNQAARADALLICAAELRAAIDSRPPPDYRRLAGEG